MLQRLLITGGSGLLATNWACGARDRFDVVLGTHRHAVNLRGTQSMEINLDSPERLGDQLRQLAPAIVIHAAGMTSVEQCEQRVSDAELANVALARNVAVATRALGIKLAHISTDHLFSGDKSYVSEDERPQPLNVYARTKLHAEQAVANANPDALIVRTNFFGWGHAQRQSFSDWIIQSLRAGRRITMFDDVFFTPILADDLAQAAHEALARDARGIYHIVGEERISKFDFGVRLADQFGLPKALISRGQIGASALSVPRPRDMSLDNKKIRTLLNRKLGSLNEFLQQLAAQEHQGRASELKNAVMEK